MKKKIAPAAIVALKEALTNIYWYKKDLRSFLTNALTDSAILATLNWDDFKRNIVGELVDRMSRRPDVFQTELLALMREVIGLEDFSHLGRLDEGKAKESAARQAVLALRKQLSGHIMLEEERRKVAARRSKAQRNLAVVTEMRKRVEDIKKNYTELADLSDRQKAGRLLEGVLRDLFEIHDLDPKASFRIVGEQIDGAFRFEGTDYLLEAKWEKKPTDAKELDSLHNKIRRRLKNTLGLFISIYGFSSEALAVKSSDSKVMFLMDGTDLMGVLDGRIGLVELILRKKMRASQTGEIFFGLERILNGE